MPYFMIILILCINLFNLSWIRKSLFEEYGAFYISVYFILQDKIKYELETYVCGKLGSLEDTVRIFLNFVMI